MSLLFQSLFYLRLDLFKAGPTKLGVKLIAVSIKDSVFGYSGAAEQVF